MVVRTPHYCCCTTHGTDFHLRWHHFPLLSQWGVKCLSVSVWERPPTGPTDLCTHWPPPAFIGMLGESQMRLEKMQSHSCLAFLNGHFQAGEDDSVKNQVVQNPAISLLAVLMAKFIPKPMKWSWFFSPLCVLQHFCLLSASVIYGMLPLVIDPAV